jgi:5'-nucleotidase
MFILKQHHPGTVNSFGRNSKFPSRSGVKPFWVGLALALALCLSPSVALAKLVHVTLLQLNDVYQMETDRNTGRGGLARIATLRKQIEAENPNTVLVLAGDTLSPSVESTLFQGKQMIALWNQLGLDVAALGNHEFDFGTEVLMQRLQESHFPWLAANVFLKKQAIKEQASILPYTLKTLDGLKIGFMGLLTPETTVSSFPGKHVRIIPPLSVVQSTLAKLEAAGADVIVAVTHQGMPEDKQLATLYGKQLAIIMGGHEHTLMQAIANGVPVFKVGSDAQQLGKIDLWIDSESKAVNSIDWELIAVDEHVAPDAETQALIDSFEQQVNHALEEPVGTTAVPLNALQRDNRSMETNLGNWIADSFRQAGHENAKADIALVNGGSIRSNQMIPAGVLTRRTLVNMLPFSNAVVTLKLSGEQLKTVLEHSVSAVEDQAAGRFLQISGFSFAYNPKNQPGNRVSRILIHNRPVQANEWLTVATSTYLAKGGDGFTMLTHCPRIETKMETKVETTGKTTPQNAKSHVDVQILEAALMKASQPIAPITEHRITRL